MKRYVGQTILLGMSILLGGFYFVFAVPALWGYDEPAHFGRAYQISELGVRADKIAGDVYGGSMPSTFVVYEKAARGGWSSVDRSVSPNSRADTRDNEPDNSAYSLGMQGERSDFEFNGAAVYAPVAYLPQAATIAVSRVLNFSLGTTLLLTRIITLLLYALLILSAFWLLRKSHQKYLVAVIGLLPGSVAQASMIGLDPAVTGLSLVLFALYIRAWKKGLVVEKYDYIGMIAIAMFLPLLKPTYVFLALPMIAIRQKAKSTDRKSELKRVLVLAAMVLTPLLVWLSLVSEPLSNIGKSNMPDAASQLQHIVQKPKEFLGTLKNSFILLFDPAVKSLFGRISRSSMTVQLWVMVCSAGLLALASLQKPNKEVKNNRVTVKLFPYALGVIAIVAAAGIVGSFYLNYTPVGAQLIEGVQGRYFVPLLPFLLFSIGLLLPLRLAETNDKRMFAFFVLSSSFLLASSVWWHWTLTY